MPANYAHHRFGNQILKDMPADVRRPIQRFRRLFNAGLHGPDIFFYYNPFMKTEVGDLGNLFHSHTGQEFFTQVCRRLHRNPSEAGLAYLYGLLAHYCLDIHVHPFVIQMTDDTGLGHVELETEFDRYLLELDGKIPPHTQDLSGYFKITRGECVTVADFYPTATPANINQCMLNIRASLKLLTFKNRKLMTTVLKATPDSVSQQQMTVGPNPKCSHLNEKMLQYYNEALDCYPKLAEQLAAHMDYGAELGEDFVRSFN